MPPTHAHTHTGGCCAIDKKWRGRPVPFWLPVVMSAARQGWRPSRPAAHYELPPTATRSRDQSWNLPFPGATRPAGALPTLTGWRASNRGLHTGEAVTCQSAATPSTPSCARSPRWDLPSCRKYRSAALAMTPHQTLGTGNDTIGAHTHARACTHANNWSSRRTLKAGNGHATAIMGDTGSRLPAGYVNTNQHAAARQSGLHRSVSQSIHAAAEGAGSGSHAPDGTRREHNS